MIHETDGLQCEIMSGSYADFYYGGPVTYFLGTDFEVDGIEYHVGSASVCSNHMVGVRVEYYEDAQDAEPDTAHVFRTPRPLDEFATPGVLYCSKAGMHFEGIEDLTHLPSPA